jgi:hypothetical protein
MWLRIRSLRWRAGCIPGARAARPQAGTEAEPSEMRVSTVCFAALASLAAASCAHLPQEGPGPEPIDEPRFEARLGTAPAREYLRRAEGMYVVVDLDANELRFHQGREILWSAPVGTGTGLRLDSDDGNWDFSTPNGVFYVQMKELDPVWILPDWHFVKANLPIPPEDSPKRRQPGALGAAAIYLGDEISIHGTDKPELLGLRVSHGCIRLSNTSARRLFHNVQVGTPVIIVGGADIAADEVKPSDPGTPRTRRPNPLDRVGTAELLRRLDRHLKAAEDSLWVETASVLIARGLRDDAPALRGVLSRARTPENSRVEAEYATFVADAFARGSLRAVVSLARIDVAARERAAAAIVEATMRLYPGPWDREGAPWPTRRLPSSMLGPEGTLGWKALEAAEREFRAGLSSGAGYGRKAATR